MTTPQIVFRSMALALLASALLTLPAPRPAHAAGIVVNTFLDANPPVTDGGCTLREAIANANANAAVFPDCAAGTGGDTITFNVDVAITLVAPLPDITDAAGLTIDGTGRVAVVLSAPSGTPSWKVASGAPLQLVALSLDNHVPGGKPRGIENNGGTVVLYRSTLHGQTRAFVNRPGGLVVVADSSLVSNGLTGLINEGIAIVGGSLFRNNQSYTAGAPSFGGAIYNSGHLTLANTTLTENQSFNSAGGAAGGITNATSGTAVLANVTIARNLATTGAAGIVNEGSLSVANTVLDGNLSNGAAWDCEGTLTATGSNLISTPTGCTIAGTPPPIVGPAVLGPLSDNGGPTQTHALLNGSPALNAGDAAVCAAFPVEGKDQRGVARPQGPACDLRVYESDLAGTIGGRNLTITTGFIDLSWQGGTVQTGYTLLRVDTSTSAVVTTPLAAGATSYSDTTAVNGVTYCYVLLPTGSAGLLGLSDLLCGVNGSASGSPLPVGFTLALNQTSTAAMTLTSGGPEGTYLLMVPLDGSAPTTTAVTPGTFTRPVPLGGGCFVVFADGFGGAFGFSNTLCGVPGVGNLRVTGMHDKLEDVAGWLSAVASALVTVVEPATH